MRKGICQRERRRTSENKDSEIQPRYGTYFEDMGYWCLHFERMQLIDGDGVVKTNEMHLANSAANAQRSKIGLENDRREVVGQKRNLEFVEIFGAEQI